MRIACGLWPIGRAKRHGALQHFRRIVNSCKVVRATPDTENSELSARVSVYIPARLNWVIFATLATISDTKLSRAWIKHAAFSQSRRTIKIINPITLPDNDPELSRDLRLRSRGRALMNTRGAKGLNLGKSDFFECNRRALRHCVNAIKR